MEDGEAVFATLYPQFSILASESALSVSSAVKGFLPGGRRKDIAAAANERNRGEIKSNSQPALRIGSARDRLWPSSEVDNQSDKRNQPAQHYDKRPIR